MISFKSRWLVGFSIVLLGSILLLNNLNITNINISNLIFTYWPVILILLGFSCLLNLKSKGDVLSGFLITLIGFLFLSNNLKLFYFDLSMLWKLLWPTLLILTGGSFLIGYNPSDKTNFAFMGGIEKKRKPWRFEGSSYFAFMGGIELDLTIADIPEGEHLLDLTAIMGGIDIIIPLDIEVQCQGVVALGGLELLDRSTGGIISSTKSSQAGAHNNKKCIKIFSRALMGGISVKSQ